MNGLVVVAHPDDEVLGAGATLYTLAQQGHTLWVCILSGEVNARANRPELIALHEDVSNSLKRLGVQQVIKGSFQNIEFNNVPHLRLVQFIEQAIIESQADLILTHHPADTNNDHLHTSLACQAALRIFQRRPELKAPKELLFMEVPSATEWSVNQAMHPFRPNTFIEVGEAGVQAKLDALAEYQGVMRPYPHPRSPEAIRGLAATRGSQAGQLYAEAFECVFRRGF
jgi:LmbE family N-acetylglucosaminyl deacetylase